MFSPALVLLDTCAYCFHLLHCWAFGPEGFHKKLTLEPSRVWGPKPYIVVSMSFSTIPLTLEPSRLTGLPTIFRLCTGSCFQQGQGSLVLWLCVSVSPRAPMYFLFGFVVFLGRGLPYTTQKGTTQEGLGRFWGWDADED